MRNIDSLLSVATSVGFATKAEIEMLDKRNTIAKELRGEAKKTADLVERETAGFGSPMFMGLASLGTDYAREFNDFDTQDARDAAAAVARVFLVSCTGASDKTLAGGTINGYASAIRLGPNAERARCALQARILHYYAESDSDVPDESAQDKAARKANAKRYITPCGTAPNADGSWPEDAKGNPVLPKFNGRPATTVRGITIPFGRGTDRKAQFAAFAHLYHAHGDIVLHHEVVDAFLDNGGKYAAQDNNTPQAHASKALESLEALNLAGGAASGDATFITLAVAVLTRIAKDGLKASVAAPPQEAPEDVTEADAEDAPTDGVVLGAAPAKRRRGLVAA